MNQIKFKAMVREAGNARVITVPKQYVDDGYIVIGEEVTVTINRPEMP
jgi:putative transposon-encoded protein